MERAEAWETRRMFVPLARRFGIAVIFNFFRCWRLLASLTCPHLVPFSSSKGLATNALQNDWPLVHHLCTPANTPPPGGRPDRWGA